MSRHFPNETRAATDVGEGHSHLSNLAAKAKLASYDNESVAMTIWLVRAGGHGEFEGKFLLERRIYVTWIA